MFNIILLPCRRTLLSLATLADSCTEIDASCKGEGEGYYCDPVLDMCQPCSSICLDQEQWGTEWECNEYCPSKCPLIGYEVDASLFYTLYKKQLPILKV